MVKIYANEKFKEIKLGIDTLKKYSISNLGRLVSYESKIEKGTVLKGGLLDGYPWFVLYKVVKGKRTRFGQSFHRLVAERFIPNKNKKRIQVLHLDYNRKNNKVSNLQWATREEMVEHHKKSPAVIAARKKLVALNIARDGHKLKTTDVVKIKTMLFNPKRKKSLSAIAEQFGISDMQLYRIQRGENWKHVKVDGMATKKDMKKVKK